MTLKAAWITPAHAGSNVTLTLECKSAKPEDAVVVTERVFPAEGPQRRTIQLSGLSSADLDALRELLDAALDPASGDYVQRRVDVCKVGARTPTSVTAADHVVDTSSARDLLPEPAVYMTQREWESLHKTWSQHD